MQSAHGLVLDIVAVVCLTILLALKAIPTEAGFGVFGMIVGARAALARSGDGGGASGGSGAAAIGRGALGAVAGIMIGLGNVFGAAPKMARSLARGAAVVVLAVALLACATVQPRDIAIDSINAASSLGSNTEEYLAGMYKGEQGYCLALATKATKDKAQGCVDDVRKRYAPAWAAYGEVVTKRLAVVAAVKAYDAQIAAKQTPSPASMQEMTVDLASAEASFEAAVKTIDMGSVQ